jgi:hypothetical protein
MLLRTKVRIMGQGTCFPETAWFDLVKCQIRAKHSSVVVLHSRANVMYQLRQTKASPYVSSLSLILNLAHSTILECLWALFCSIRYR